MSGNDVTYDKRLASALSGMPDPIITIDNKKLISSWNKAAARLYQINAGAVIGQHLTAILPAALVTAIDDHITNTEKKSVSPVVVSISGRDAVLNAWSITSAEGKDEGAVLQLRVIEKADTQATKATGELQQLIDMLPQLVWQNSSSGEANYFNQRFLDYSGLSATDLWGKGWEAIAHPDDTLAVNTWRRAEMLGEIFESEAYLRRADGVYQWHLLYNVPLKDDAGNVIAWFGSATNIDQQKEVQASLREISEILHTTLETASEFAIITMDAQGKILNWNSGAELIFGYDRKEVIGKHSDIIFTEEDIYGNVPMFEFQEAAATGRSADERWHIRRDRSRLFMSGVMAPIINEGKLQGFVKIARNITERKLAEEALLLSQEHVNTPTLSNNMGHWKWDIRENSINYSDHAQHILGLSNTGNSAPFFQNMVVSEDRDRVLQQLQAAIDGLNIFHAECRIERTDNAELKWVNVYGRLIQFDEQGPVTMIGVVYDITERKMFEKDKDDFINIASHEMKTPVTSIKVYSDLFAEQFAGSESGVLAERLKNQVDRLVRLIHHLLDATQVSEGQLLLYPEIFDINEVISEQVKESETLATGHSIHWTPQAVPLITADKERIRQVITNFLSNAIKYSRKDGPIYISASDNLDHLMVRVKDSGQGIPTAETGRIFQRYRRSLEPEVRRHPGLGLGLYISAEIIRLHHGSIGVDSIAGQGADFYFTIPYR